MPSVGISSQDRLSLGAVRQSILTCQRCPRLRSYCEGIASTRRRAYRDQTYWALPVPGFGDPAARVLVLGLAPGAHGANRTGRPFTGDGSGDFLYPVLYETGFASQPLAVSRDDGLRLHGMWISSVVRCAPPADKPTPEEIRHCAVHLREELQALPSVQVVVCLGRIAWEGYLAQLHAAGEISRKRDFRFTHGAEFTVGPRWLLGSYHPSLRNTNTGRLDMPMLTRIFVRARQLAQPPDQGVHDQHRAEQAEHALQADRANPDNGNGITHPDCNRAQKAEERLE